MMILRTNEINFFEWRKKTGCKWVIYNDEQTKQEK